MALLLVVIATPAAAKDLYLRCPDFNYLVSKNIFGNNTIKIQLEGRVEWLSPREFRKVGKDADFDGDLSVNDEQIILDLDGITIRYDLIPYWFNERRQEGRHKGRTDSSDGRGGSEQCTGRWVER